MKRMVSFLVSALAFLASALLLAACAIPAAPVATPSPAAETTATPVATPTQAPTVVPTDTPSPTVSPTATAAVTPTPTPSGPRMYSSYADLVSFDPGSGIGKFDYFDMLDGDEAIEFLVAHEGYTQADAEELVENFAESEFVKKNTNPQLREIDLDDVGIRLMVQPNGEFVDDAEPVSSTAADFRAIYALKPDRLLDSYFYYITVESDGQVSKVEQVYWP